MSKIKVIEHHEAEGRLKEIYDDLINSRGKLAEVHKIQSLRPESIVKHMDLYLEIMFSRSELSRAEREMLAVIVSVSNQCEYCQLHHALALNHYWKDDQKVEQLKKDYQKLALTKRELALCNYAQTLTLEPGSRATAEVDELKSLELSDQGILDATLVIAYFNFVNRIVLGLEVGIEENAGGYNY